MEVDKDWFEDGWEDRIIEWFGLKGISKIIQFHVGR